MEDSKRKASTFWQDLRLAWSFHSYFLPFLFPAACLLLLALAAGQSFVWIDSRRSANH